MNNPGLGWSFAISDRAGRALFAPLSPGAICTGFIVAPKCEVGPQKKAPGPFGGATGLPTSSLLLLDNALRCIDSSSRLDLDNPEAPSTPTNGETPA